MRIGELESLLLFVSDLDAAKRFYVDLLGLPIIFEDGIVVVLKTGSGRVVLHRNDKGHDDPEAFHRIEEYQHMAKDLGATVVNLVDRNVSDALIRFAQQENISHVVFGQPIRSRWDILLRGSVLNRFLSEVRDVTVQVVPMQKPIRRSA